jgi:hypothetical protein
MSSDSDATTASIRPGGNTQGGDDFQARLTVIRSNGADNDILQRIAESRLQGFKQKRDKSVACCPFHAETSPSFEVIDGRYHCWGGACGARGDVIDLVMHTDGLTFRDAADRISADIGLTDADDYVIPERQQNRKRELVQFTPIKTDTLPLPRFTAAGKSAVNRWRHGKRDRTYPTCEILSSRNPDRHYSVKVQALYPYRDMAGEIQGVVVRYLNQEGNKSTPFLAYGRVSEGRAARTGWFDDVRSGKNGYIFNLPALRNTLDIKAILIVVAGEKDCLCGDELLSPFGLVSLSFAGGDAEVLRPDWEPVIATARLLGVPVIGLADHDVSGYLATAKLGELMREHGVEWRQPDANLMELELRDNLSDLANKGVTVNRRRKLTPLEPRIGVQF